MLVIATLAAPDRLPEGLAVSRSLPQMAVIISERPNRVLGDQKNLSSKRRDQTAAGVAVPEADHAAAAAAGGTGKDDCWSRMEKGHGQKGKPRTAASGNQTTFRQTSGKNINQQTGHSSASKKKKNLLLPACLLDFTVSVQLLF